MAKIRGIKPETWTDDKFVRLSPLARLLFIGMWNFACDNGHLEDNALQLKMRILPADNCDVSELLDELVASGRVLRSEGYLSIPKLHEHQRIDKRWFTTCEWCEHVESTSSPRRAPAVAPQGSRDELSGVDGDGDGELIGSELVPSQAKPRAKRATQLRDDWQPTDQHRALAQERNVDLTNELATFRDYYRATGKTMKDWDATFRNWIRRAHPTRGLGSRQQETDNLFARAAQRMAARETAR